MTSLARNAAFAVLLNAFVFGLIQSARADVCCPSGCVPLNNGTTTCVKDGHQPDLRRHDLWWRRRGRQRKRRRPGPDLRRPYSSTISLRALAAMQLRQRRRDGLDRQQFRHPLHESAEIMGLHKGGLRQRMRWRRSGFEYSGGWQKVTLNLFTLQYHNLCTNELPMTFLARIGSFPDTIGSCDCNIPLPAPPYGPASCRQGFVWRNAFNGDAVCVTPARKNQVQGENANAGSTSAGSGPMAPTRARTASSGARRGPPTLFASRRRVARK